MELQQRSAEWLDTAVSGIRFGPDRSAARAELAAHLEDKLAGLHKRFPDIPPEEAEQRALDGMGDAEEIRRALAKVHPAWLGYLWLASRCLIICGIAMYLGSLLVRLPDSWYEPNRPSFDGYTLELAPDRQTVSVDGYTISMIEARGMPGTEGVSALDVRLRMAGPRFWALNGNGLYRHMEAEDSLGNRYVQSEEPSAAAEHSSPFRCVLGDTDGRGPFHRNYILWVLNIHPAAEWVRLEYDWLGRNFSMTVELRGGGT